jgi:hypothetical protein
MEQFFIQDGWRNNDPPIECREEGNLVNQDQVIEEGGVGNNLHYPLIRSRVARSFSKSSSV